MSNVARNTTGKLKYLDPEDWRRVAAMGGDPGAFPGERARPGVHDATGQWVEPKLSYSFSLYRTPEPTRKQVVDDILASHGVRPRKRRSLSDPAPTSDHMPPPAPSVVRGTDGVTIIRRTLGHIVDVR